MDNSRDIGQIVKWTVYGLLLVNFLYYFGEEIYISSHTLRDGGSLLDWAGEFATTLDEIAWLGLILLFELETYQLSDESWERRSVRWSVHGVRLFLYVLLAHTVWERMNSVLEFNQVVQAEEISSLCQVADRGISFGRNYRYELIDDSNCGSLSEGGPFYFLEPSVVTDRDGYLLEEKHVWVDLNDACIWLIVVLLIELAVRFQNRDLTGRPLIWLDRSVKLLYGILLMHAVFWLWVDHWLYAWDQVVWIAGFWVIEHNLAEWRAEMTVGTAA